MRVALFILLGLFCQAFWTFCAGFFGFETQPIPLFILFAYGVLVLPLNSRLFLAVAVGWLMDLHGGGVFGFHVAAFSLLAFGGAWYQRNLTFFRSSLFPLWVVTFYCLSSFVLAFFTLPFANVYNPFSFFEQLLSAFWHGAWAIVLFPFYAFCSKQLSLESEEAVRTREGWAHGR